MVAEKYRTLMAKLDVFEQWPHAYTFKFIVPVARRDELLAVFEGLEYRLRESRTGKYLSLTCVRELPDAESVIAVYERVDEIEGSFSL